MIELSKQVPLRDISFRLVGPSLVGVKSSTIDTIFRQGMTTMDQYTNVGMSKKYEQSASFFATIFDGNLDAIKQPNIKGENPKKAGEITLAVNSSKKYEKKLAIILKSLLMGKRQIIK